MPLLEPDYETPIGAPSLPAWTDVFVIPTSSDIGPPPLIIPGPLLAKHPWLKRRFVQPVIHVQTPATVAAPAIQFLPQILSGPLARRAPWIKLKPKQPTFHILAPATASPTTPVALQPGSALVNELRPTDMNQSYAQLIRFSQIVSGIFNSLFRHGDVYKVADGYRLAGGAGGVLGFNGRAGLVTLQTSDLPDSGVTPGGYVNPSITVDTHGLITSIAPGKLIASYRVAADVVVTSTTLTAMPFVATLQAGKQYTGRLVLRTLNGTGADGMDVDFGGGTCTATDFLGILHQVAGTAGTVGTASVTGLTTKLVYNATSGQTVSVIYFSMLCLQAGTLTPRFAKDGDAAGDTLTLEKGSWMQIQEVG